jgi:hypothetical protein
MEGGAPATPLVSPGLAGACPSTARDVSGYPISPYNSSGNAFFDKVAARLNGQTTEARLY